MEDKHVIYAEEYKERKWDGLCSGVVSSVLPMNVTMAGQPELTQGTRMYAALIHPYALNKLPPLSYSSLWCLHFAYC